MTESFSTAANNHPVVEYTSYARMALHLADSVLTDLYTSVEEVQTTMAAKRYPGVARNLNNVKEAITDARTMAAALDATVVDARKPIAAHLTDSSTPKEVIDIFTKAGTEIGMALTRAIPTLLAIDQVTTAIRRVLDGAECGGLLTRVQQARAQTVAAVQLLRDQAAPAAATAVTDAQQAANV